MNPSKQVVTQLIKDMESRPEDWEIVKNSYFLADNKSNTAVLIKDGCMAYCIMYPDMIRLSVINQFLFHRAFKKWKAWGRIEEVRRSCTREDTIWDELYKLNPHRQDVSQG